MSATGTKLGRSLWWAGRGLLAAVVLGLTPTLDAEQVDFDRFLHAIAQVETGGNQHSIGRHGERGLYQIGAVTWRQHSRLPFYRAHDPEAARQVALKHLRWLHDGLLRNRIQPTPELLAMAWNCGLSATINRRIPKRTYDYAGRVTNLYRRAVVIDRKALVNRKHYCWLTMQRQTMGAT